jgi:hypothetical protein
LLKILLAILAVTFAAIASITPARADETCNSPCLSRLIQGQEDCLYV